MTRRTAIPLLVAIVLLGGIVLFINANPERAAAPTPTTDPSTVADPLWVVDPSLMNGITVTDNEKKLTFSATLDEAGQWKITQPQAGDADPLHMSTVVNTVSALYINRRITEEANLADFGLAEPKYVLEIKLSDGTSHRAVVGTQSVGGSAYYVLPQGESQPVLVGSATLDTLLLLPGQPPFVTPTPVATAVTSEPLPTLPLSGTATP